MAGMTVKYKPSIMDMLRMPLVGGGRVSPDGSKAIFRLGYMDHFEENELGISTFLYDCSTGETRLFASGIFSQERWIDDQSLSFMKPVPGSGFQIHVIDERGGEGVQVTDHPGGIANYELYGGGFLYLAQSTRNPRADRERKFGPLTDVEEEVSRSALYFVDREKMLAYRQAANRTRKGTIKPIAPVCELSELLPEKYKIDLFLPSPGDGSVYLNCQSKDDAFYSNDTSCFKIEFDPATLFDTDGQILPRVKVSTVALPKGARIAAVSPDGRTLLVSCKKTEKGENVQAELSLLDATLLDETLEGPGLESRLTCITGDFDQEPLDAYWTQRGIFVSYWNGSTRRIARLDECGRAEDWDIQGLSLEYFHLTGDASLLLRAASSTLLTEIYIGVPGSKGWSLKRITNLNEQYADWDFGTAESIEWTSKDGTRIEGILRKPSDFDPNKKYPLIFNVHGGPAAASPFILLENNNRFFYPTVQLLHKGILVLEPNYRGSLGRGQAFLSLNFDNLGTGDMWDLESAIDALDAQGFVDRDRVGSMGWSQGGYISAYAAMHTDLLKAASAGAALSDWRIYYGGSDERQSILLSGDPYTNRDGYERAAPISAINRAKTPILFQHGENDPRVPVISAMEMYRALKARGVETRLIVFPGQGHGFLKPRQCYAVMVQNYRWFLHHLLGEELELFLDDSAVPSQESQ